MLLLTLSLMSVTASGYVVNDLYDTSTDRLNEKGRVLACGQLSPATARRVFLLLSLAGAGWAFWVAIRQKELQLFWIYPLAWAGLYAYARWRRHWGLSGNLLIAIYCAAVCGLPFLAERESLQTLTDIPQLARAIWWGMALFAGLSTLFRELVKDLEDVIGDRSEGYRTLAVSWGVAQTRMVTSLLGWVISLLYSWLAFTYFATSVHLLLSGLILVSLPFAMMAYRLFKARSKAFYRTISQASKWAMLGGILQFILLAQTLL